MSERVLMRVEPHMAEEWLKTGREDNFRPAKFDRLVRALEQETWNPELHRNMPVMMVGGKLGNGHHRLRAIVHTGIAADLWVRL